MFWCLCETGLKQGLDISQTVRSAPFFFCFLNFGLNCPFRPIRLIQARVGPIPHESARVGRQVGSRCASRLKARGIHVAQRGGTRKQWRLLHVATSDAGAAPLVPHPCFIIHHTPTHITQSIKLGHHMKCQRTLKAANPTHLNSKHEFSIIIKSTNHKVQQSISLHV